MGHYAEELEAWENEIQKAREDAVKRPTVELLGIAAGGPGSGKDTLYGLLESHGFDVVNVKFADALTEEVHDQLTGWGYAEFLEIRNRQDLKDHKFRMFCIDKLMPGPYKSFLLSMGLDPYEKRTARWHMLQYGTHFVRTYLGQDDYWLNKGIAKAREVYQSGRVPVITDVRFPNELAKVHSIGGDSIYLRSNWAFKDGGVADGLIKPEDCHMRFTNTYGKPEDLLTQFLQCYTMKKKGAN